MAKSLCAELCAIQLVVGNCQGTGSLTLSIVSAGLGAAGAFSATIIAFDLSNTLPCLSLCLLAHSTVVDVHYYSTLAASLMFSSTLSGAVRNAT